jgi:TM2 domain-containing membrane protein YozV
MSNESEENARLVTCRCQICNGAIEFDANELNGRESARVECPHCTLETVIFVPRVPFSQAAQADSDVAKAPPTIPTMFCRNCGKPVNSAAIACLGCGAPPGSQKNFCWNCGKVTTPVQIICVSCGVSLETPKVETPEHRSKLAAGLLAIFLGSLGIHKFYLGYSTEGIILLLVSVIGGIFTCGIACCVTFLFTLAEGIVYLAKSDKEFHNSYVLHKRPWC